MSETNRPTIASSMSTAFLTTGQFLYSVDGKAYKIFGPHDNDGIKLLSQKIEGIVPDRRPARLPDLPQKDCRRYEAGVGPSGRVRTS